MSQTQTQSQFICFGGERRLGVRLRHARGLMGRDKGKIAMKNFLSVPKLSKLKVRLCQQGARVFATSVVCLQSNFYVTFGKAL